MNRNLEEAFSKPLWLRHLQYDMKPGLTVRLLSPLANYPVCEFLHKDAVLVFKEDVAVLAARVWPLKFPEDYYSEVEFASPFEVRCMAAVLLSATTESMCSMYPAPLELAFALDNIDLTDLDTVTHVVARLRKFLAEKVSDLPKQHWPPCMGGTAYEINVHAELDVARQHNIFDAIDVNDHLLIRGLGSLIQSGMLSRHQEFLENACMSLWVALDASFQIVLRQLKNAGKQNPSSGDAAAYLATAFQSKGEQGKYFEEYYEDRIKTMHPASKFGIYPSAPLSADDFYFLYQALLPTYDFLITGHVRKDWLER